MSIQAWTQIGNNNPKMGGNKWPKCNNLKGNYNQPESKSRMKKNLESKATFSQIFANVFQPIIQIDRKNKRINRVMKIKTDKMKYNNWTTMTLI